MTKHSEEKKSVTFIKKCLFDVPSSERNILHSLRERYCEKELLNVDKHVIQVLGKDKRPSIFLFRKGRYSLLLSSKSQNDSWKKKTDAFSGREHAALTWLTQFLSWVQEFKKTCGTANNQNKDHPMAAYFTVGAMMQTIHI